MGGGGGGVSPSEFRRLQNEVSLQNQTLAQLKATFRPSRRPILSTTSYPQYYRDLTTTEKSIQDIMGMTKCPASLKDKPFDVGLCEENENADILPTVMGVLSKIQEASTLERDRSGRIHTIRSLKYVIKDTHLNPYLDQLAPDITVVQAGHVVSGFNAVFLIELQKGKLDNEHRGKAYRYCQLLLEGNESRTWALTVLTNTATLQVFRASRFPSRGLVFEHSQEVCTSVGWPLVVSMLTTMTTSQLGFDLPKLLLGESPLRVIGFLGRGRGANVYLVKLDQQEVACKQVKESRKASYERERNLLLELQSSAPISSVFPVLLANDDTSRLLLTSPVGRPFEHPTARPTLRMLSDLLATLSHLHLTLGRVHRDLEPKHLLRHQGEGQDGVCLIDLDCSAPLVLPEGIKCRLLEGGGSGGQGDREMGGQEEVGEPESALAMEVDHIRTNSYSGTLIYASDDVLEGLATGCVVTAHACQDMVPLAKSLYIMSFPEAQMAMEELMTGVEMALGSLSSAVPPPLTSVQAAVKLVRNFWNARFSTRDLRGGQDWERIFGVAHFRVPMPPSPPPAADVSQSAQSQVYYNWVCDELLGFMGRILPHSLNSF